MVRRAMRFHRGLVIIAFEHFVDARLIGAEQLVIAVPGLVRLHRGGEFGEHALERPFLAGLHAQRGDPPAGPPRNPPPMVGPPPVRPEERRVGKEGVSPCRPRWPPPP